MYALVSLLDDTHYARLEELWTELDLGCALAGVALTPLPHFSWLGTIDFDFKPLEEALGAFAARATPFRVRTTGLGIFTGRSPVVYIPLVKDQALLDFHRQVWELAVPLSAGANEYYSPENWMPHITLAYYDVDVHKLACAMEKLVMRSFNWEIEIDHLALVYQHSGQVGGLQQRFPFGGVT